MSESEIYETYKDLSVQQLGEMRVAFELDLAGALRSKNVDVVQLAKNKRKVEFCRTRLRIVDGIQRTRLLAKVPDREMVSIFFQAAAAHLDHVVTLLAVEALLWEWIEHMQRSDSDALALRALQCSRQIRENAAQHVDASGAVDLAACRDSLLH